VSSRPERRLHTWVVPSAVRLRQKRSTGGVDVVAVVNIAAVGSGGRNDVEAERQAVQHIGETTTDEVAREPVVATVGRCTGWAV
jgi:ATP-dependent protease HslVU (ClpYQ) peptidase subunit